MSDTPRTFGTPSQTGNDAGTGGMSPDYHDGDRPLADTSGITSRASLGDNTDGLGRDRTDALRGNEDHKLISADKVIGTRVYGDGGDSIGTVDSIMLNKRSGQVAYAVMSAGGFLGIGERYSPLPWKALSYDEQMDGYKVGHGSDRLREGPNYSRDELQHLDYKNEGSRIRGYYGNDPDMGGAALTGSSGRSADPTGLVDDGVDQGRPGTVASRTLGLENDRMGGATGRSADPTGVVDDRVDQGRPGTVVSRTLGLENDRMSGGTGARSTDPTGAVDDGVDQGRPGTVVSRTLGLENDRMGSTAGDMGADMTSDEDHSLISADKVIGTAVYNGAGDRLGTIDTVMLNKRSGRVAYAVMSFGGFLGIGERYHPLPWDALTYSEEKGGYDVDQSADTLRDAPSYSREELDSLDYGDQGSRIRGYYGTDLGSRGGTGAGAGMSSGTGIPSTTAAGTGPASRDTMSGGGSASTVSGDPTRTY